MSAQENDVKEEDIADAEAAEVCTLYGCGANNIHTSYCIG